MSNETIAVPRALLTELAKAASESEQSALASQAFDLLPEPVPELRVINLGHLDSFIQGWFDADTESQEISRELREDIAKHFDMPDSMTVIEHALTHGPRGVADVIGPEAYIRVGNAIERIRAALEGANQ